jgi:hypothetical protein
MNTIFHSEMGINKEYLSEVSMFITISLLPKVPNSENQRHLFRYVNFINSRPKRDLIKEKGFCLHHILPVSMGGTDEQLIKLTYREHYIAHLILWNCGYPEMVTAFFLINTPWYKGKYYHKNYINSKQFERIQKERAENLSANFKGSKNPNWNHKWNEKQRDNLSKFASERFKNARWMNNGKISRFTEEVKIQLRLNSGWVFGRLNQAPTNIHDILMNNGVEEKFVSLSEFDTFISQGWKLGTVSRRGGYKKRIKNIENCQRGRVT